jgi:hypothetical protein
MEIKWREFQFHAAGFDLGKIEDLVNQGKQMLARCKNISGVLSLFLVQFPKQSFLQNFREADDGVERRSQLVGHVGEKLRFVAVGSFDLAALVLNFAEQPGIVNSQCRLCGKGLQQIHYLGFELPGLPPPDS